MDRPGTHSRGATRRATALRLAVAATGLVLFAWPAAAGPSARPAGADPGLPSFDLVGHTGGPVRSAAIVSVTAWIGEGIGVTEIDVRDLEDPRQRWHLPLGEGADVWSVRSLGDLLLVAAADGLYAIDRDHGGAPRVVDRLAFDAPVRAVTPFELPGVAGRYAFAVTPGRDVAIVGVDSDGSMARVGIVADSARASVPVAVDGTRAVVAADDVLVLDISDPRLPLETGRVATAGTVRGLAARDGLAYIADSVEGLLVVSLDAPDERLGHLPTVAAGRLVPHGQLLYLLEQHPTGPNTVRLLDVADPALPHDVLGGESTYEVVRGALDVAIAGDTAVWASADRAAVADIRDVRWPAVRSEHVVVWPLYALADAGGCVYVAQGDAGLGVVDVRSPASPQVWASWRPEGGVAGVHVRDAYAYVAAANGLNRVDVSDACDPVPREMPLLADWPATAWMDSSTDLLAATTSQALHLAEFRPDGVLAPAAAVSYASLPGWPVGAVAQGVAMGHDTAFVAAGVHGLAVVSLADPAAPAIARMLPIPEGSAVLSVAARGARLVAGTSAGVLVYDVRQPLSPRLVGTHADGYSARSVALAEDGSLYVSADLDGLLALDLADEGRPRERARWSPPFPVTAARAGDDVVYAAASGLVVLHEQPALVSPTPSPTVTETPEPSPTPGRPVRSRTCYIPVLPEGDARWP